MKTFQSILPPALRFAIASGIVLLAAADGYSQARVDPVWFSTEIRGANIDSVAVWAAPDPGDSLLFVTEKDLDRVEVRRAATGLLYSPQPFLGGPLNSSRPGEFDRPNGVWVIYRVPYAGGFADVLLVVDQTNLRVQIFRMPSLEYFGEFGTGEIGKGYGIAWYHDGTDIFVFITDNIPLAAFPGKLKKYRLAPKGDQLGGDLVLAFGSSSGPPPLPNVESILVDPVRDWLHVCGDEGGDFNRIFRLDGSYTGIEYGDPQFQADQEGINLYDTGGGNGYLVVSDQRTGGAANEFEVFDRKTLASLGNFRSPAQGNVFTSNTDGAYLEQRPLPGFPNGAFYAVHDDKQVHAYDWTDIAEAMGLEIVALDRPFPSRPPEAAAPGPRALWRRGGFWWAALPAEGGLALARLEEGTFARALALAGGGSGEALALWPGESDLALLEGGAPPRLHHFRYLAAGRSYEPVGGPEVLDFLPGTGTCLAREGEPPGAGRSWLAWVAGGELKVSAGNAEFTGWDTAGVPLGSAAPAVPELFRLGSSTAALWSAPGEVVFRLHPDGAPADGWLQQETAAAGFDAASICAAALPDGRVMAVASDAQGRGRLLTRAAGGGWSGQDLGSGITAPVLTLDPAGGMAQLAYLTASAGRRMARGREIPFADLIPGPERLLIGQPGVDLKALVAPARPEPDAREIIIVARGGDGSGYFARLPTAGDEDRGAPVALQHVPAPGARDVPAVIEGSFRIVDDGAGVDRSSLRVLVGGSAVPITVRGVPRNYLVRFPIPSGAGPQVQVRIEAADRSNPPRVMEPFEYTFTLASSGPTAFRRGDANGDAELDISDPVRLLLGIFHDQALISCRDAADADDNGAIEITDAVTILEYLFIRGPALPPPSSGCGIDPTGDALDCLEQLACN